MTNVQTLANLPIPEPFDYAGIRIAITFLCTYGELLRVLVSTSVRVPSEYLFVPPMLHDDPDATLREIVGQAVALAAARRGRLR